MYRCQDCQGLKPKEPNVACPTCGSWQKAYFCPSLEYIKAATAEIRKRWSRAEKQKRIADDNLKYRYWLPTNCSMPELSRRYYSDE